MAKGKGKILVEEVAQKFGHAKVGPTSVNEQQTFEIPKLGNAVIWRQDGLDSHNSHRYNKNKMRIINAFNNE